MMKSKRLERLILAALFTALIAVFTVIIAIPVPMTNGYVHLGDSMIFLSVLLLGWKHGAIAAALGSALADIYLGYVHYAPWTFAIKGGMALIMGLLIHEGIKSKKHLVLCAVIVSALWLVLNLATQYITRAEGEMQLGVMFFALAIPVLLIVATLVMQRNDRMGFPAVNIIAMTGGGLFMVFGYFIAGSVMYGNHIVAALSIPPNIIQFAAGFVIAAAVYAALAKTPIMKKSYYGR